ncbi:MAG: adenylate/guanylate cyclase domain-containing protein [Armatimonadetes bacterium]|nr:adenylate/guanylate cyclase domain-containing protein [Armatimonadota bacterium]
MRQFFRSHARNLRASVLIAVLVSAFVSVYLTDFAHRHDEHLREDAKRKQGETEASFNKRKERLEKVERIFYRQHYGWEPWENFELKLYDLRFRSRGGVEARDDIVIFAIDNESFEQVGVFPWPRRVYGEAARRLAIAGAKVIAFDVLFDTPQDPEEDAQFRKGLLASHGKVILSADIDEKEKSTAGNISSVSSVALPIPELEEAAWDIGVTKVVKDSDSFVRSYTVYLERHEPADTPSGSAWNVYPSFVASVAGKYLGISPDQLRTGLKKGLMRNSRVYLLNRHQDRRRSLHGYNTLINFAGPATHFQTLSFYEAIDPSAKTDQMLKTVVKDKIVLIGASAEILHDLFPTPYMERGNTPGIEIHANALQTILSGDYVRVTPPWLNECIIFLMSIVTAIVTVFISKPVSSLATIFDARLSFRVKNSRIGIYGLAWFLMYLGGGFFPPAVIYFLCGFYAFTQHNLWLPMGYTLVAIMLTYLFCVVYMFLTEEQEKKKMFGRFQRFVAPSVLTQIMAHPTEEYPRPRRVEATLVFTDLQGFTTLSEANEPEVVVAVLNEYIDRMASIIFKYQGTIDKYIGDAIMVIFGAPVPFPDHAERAIRSAVEMQEECAKFREYGRSQGWPDFYMRIGVHTGEPMVGSIGAKDRLDYTAIGDDVNLASRLEGLNKQYHSWIMCSSLTYERVKDVVIAEYVPAAQVKGKTHAVDVYKVYGLQESGRRDDFWGEGADAKAPKPAEAAGEEKPGIVS